MNLEHRPHDTFFRQMFSQPALMQGLLEQALPADIFNQLDISSLKVESNSYLDDEGKHHFADLAASVNLCFGRPARRGIRSQPDSTQPAQAKPSRAKIYILYEHKSWNDKKALLQLLRYQQQTW